MEEQLLILRSIWANNSGYVWIYSGNYDGVQEGLKKMIKIDIILGSKDISPWREEMICMSGALELIAAKSVLANRGMSSGSRNGVFS